MSHLGSISLGYIPKVWLNSMRTEIVFIIIVASPTFGFDILKNVYTEWINKWDFFLVLN